MYLSQQTNLPDTWTNLLYQLTESGLKNTLSGIINMNVTEDSYYGHMPKCLLGANVLANTARTRGHYIESIYRTQQFVPNCDINAWATSGNWLHGDILQWSIYRAHSESDMTREWHNGILLCWIHNRLVKSRYKPVFLFELCPKFNSYRL